MTESARSVSGSAERAAIAACTLSARVPASVTSIMRPWCGRPAAFRPSMAVACGARVSMPATPSASTAMAPPPPVVVMTDTARFGDASGLRPMNSAGDSRSASIIVTRAMPLARKKASAAASLPASAPVWLLASSAPKDERPSLKAMIGLPASCARRAASASRSARRIASRNSRIASVSGSSTSRPAISLAVRSASLPVLIRCEKPRPRAAPRAMIAPSIEPDCDTSASRPGGRVSASSAALTEHALRPFTFTRPIEFGPRMRTPAARAVASRRSCRATPSGPASAKPSARIAATGMPFAATSAMTPSTCSVASSR